METNQNIEKFLLGYSDTVFINSLKLRQLILETIPEIVESLDLSAKMISYGFGNKYSELLCVIIPSKKGIKIGFNYGAQFPDPKGLLKGSGKISRYLEIKSHEEIYSPELLEILIFSIGYYEKMKQEKNEGKK